LKYPHVRLVATFEDGEALFQVICDRGLEGGGREAAARSLPTGGARMAQDEEQSDASVC
jgi:hypothetical protein